MDEQVPGELEIWLRAAFKSPATGRLPTVQAGKALGVTPRTIRRWVSREQELTRARQVRLIQRAILRGRGEYLWPALPSHRAQFEERVVAKSVRRHLLIRDHPDQVPQAWRDNGTLRRHDVLLVWYPKAHVYGLTVASHLKTTERAYRNGQIVKQTTASNRYEAQVLKLLTLQRVLDYRCVAPRSLVKTGHTETWRASGGVPSLVTRIPVRLLR